MVILRCLSLILGLFVLLTAGMLSILRQQQLHQDWLTLVQFTPVPAPPSLYLLDPETGQLTILFEVPIGDTFWSADNNAIIIEVHDSVEYKAIYQQVSLATRQIQWKAALPMETQLDFLLWGDNPLHVGAWMYYTKFDNQIYRRQVSSDPQEEQITDANVNFPYDLSPDEEWLAMTSGQAGGAVDLFLLRSDGSEQRQLTDTPAHRESYPVWRGTHLTVARRNRHPHRAAPPVADAGYLLQRFSVEQRQPVTLFYCQQLGAPGHDVYRRDIEAAAEVNLTNNKNNHKTDLARWPFEGFDINQQGLLLLGVVLVGLGALPFERWIFSSSGKTFRS